MTAFLMDPPEDAEDGPESDAAATDDPGAPYGRRPDGRPYTQSPEARKAFGERMAAARAAAAAGGFPARIKPGQRLRHRAPEEKPARAPRAPAAKPKVDPRLMGAQTFLLGLSAAGVAAGKLLKSPAFMYDGMTIQRHTPAVSKALADASEFSPKLATWLEGMGNIGGPWAIVGAALLPVVAQVAVNHGMLKAGAFDTIDMEAEAKAEHARQEAALDTPGPDGRTPREWRERYDRAEALGVDVDALPD